MQWYYNVKEIQHFVRQDFSKEPAEIHKVKLKRYEKTESIHLSNFISQWQEILNLDGSMSFSLGLWFDFAG